MKKKGTSIKMTEERKKERKKYSMKKKGMSIKMTA